MTIHFQAMTSGGLDHGVAEAFQFPGGEWHLRGLAKYPTGASVTWIANLRGASADELVQAGLLAQVAHSRQEPFVLFLPYLPAARSDRGTPTGAVVYADLIRSMNPQQIIGIDPHSTVIEKLLAPKLTTLGPYTLMERALTEGSHHYNAVIVPDKGAVQRASTAAETLGIDLYHAEKHRDFETGKITGIKMVDPLPPTGKYLVVDDICDGGGTFNGLAEATGLPKEQLGLWVTHGIFSGKANTLREHYQHIYTTDSHPGHNRVGVATTIVPCQTYMLENLKELV